MTARARLFTPVLIAGLLILIVGNAIRSSFGVFQIPVAGEFGWPRAEFSFAIAIQNLAWGIGAPIFGAIAERFGDRKAIVLGALCYAAGLVLSAWAVTPGQHQVLEILVGLGIAGTGFGVVLAVVGRAASDDNRSLALGVATAAGSLGQVFSAPVAEYLLGHFSWQVVFMIFAAAILSVVLVLPLMRAPERARSASDISMAAALRQALRDPSFTLIFVGFFSCGYQLGFMVAHFPAMVTEMCGPISPAGPLAALGIASTSALGAAAISLIGLANIAGTLTAGWLGKRFAKKYVLAAIYTGRTLFAALFIVFPITPLTVVLFSVGMGSLWLATVPLTSGLVGHIYGLRYMGTLYGIVFLSHQLGSFLGVWMGGQFYDLYGSYEVVWWVGVGVGAFSAIVHLPIREERRGLVAA